MLKKKKGFHRVKSGKDKGIREFLDKKS